MTCANGYFKGTKKKSAKEKNCNSNEKAFLRKEVDIKGIFGGTGNKKKQKKKKTQRDPRKSCRSFN